EDLERSFPKESFRAFTDSAPLLERDLAHHAGMGWFGKNSCLIHPRKGSFFLLGEIVTSLQLQGPSTPPPDFCGTCRRCIDACPTQAISEDRSLDAGRCISYWTIEAKKPPPDELRNSFQQWFFGCDICQDVCPENQKLLKKEKPQSFSRQDQIQDLR